MESQPSHPCDRVPKEGEEYTKFVQRTEKSENAVLRPMTPEKAKIDDPSRWELMSECESLPQDERIYFDDDMKPDRLVFLISNGLFNLLNNTLFKFFNLTVNYFLDNEVNYFYL